MAGKENQTPSQQTLQHITNYFPAAPTPPKGKLPLGKPGTPAQQAPRDIHAVSAVRGRGESEEAWKFDWWDERDWEAE